MTNSPFMRALAALVWIFGPLAVRLLQDAGSPLAWAGVLLVALWVYLPMTPAVALRPRWAPPLLALLGAALAALLFILGVIVLPFWLAVVLGVAWIPVAVRVHWAYMQRQQRIFSWQVAKVTRFKTLVEGGMPNAEAAARVNEQFGDIPGQMPPESVAKF